MADDKEFAKGLEDVIAGESSICDVDGINGKLIYRGYDIHDLAQNTTFEEVVYLLWNGSLPTTNELETLEGRIGQKPGHSRTGLSALAAVPEIRLRDGRPANRDFPAGPVRPG